MDDGPGGGGRAEDNARGGQRAVVMGDTVTVSNSIPLQLPHRKTVKKVKITHDRCYTLALWNPSYYRDTEDTSLNRTLFPPQVPLLHNEDTSLTMTLFTSGPVVSACRVVPLHCLEVSSYSVSTPRPRVPRNSHGRPSRERTMLELAALPPDLHCCPLALTSPSSSG